MRDGHPRDGCDSERRASCDTVCGTVNSGDGTAPNATVNKGFMDHFEGRTLLDIDQRDISPLSPVALLDSGTFCISTSSIPFSTRASR